MGTLLTIALIAQIVLAILLVVVVLLQNSKESGLGSTISGSNSSYLGSGKSATLDAKLGTATKWIAAIFVVLTIAVLVLLKVA